MNQKSIIQLQKTFPYTHFFVYRTKQYPLNFNFLKISSQYVQQNEIEFSQSKYINLLNEIDENNIDIDEKVIKTFIKYIQQEPIEIHNENVAILNFLGRRYMIKELIESTDEYISNHQTEIILDLLLIEQNQAKIDTITYEQAISERFLDYIKDKRIFKINISILYRIIKQYKSHQQKEKQENNDFIKFLFECLDHYGRDASVLFSEIEIDKVQIELVNLLNTKYSKIFDFHFINYSYMKNIYDQDNELLHQIKLIDEKLKEQQKINEKLTNEIESLKAEHEKKISEMKSEADERYDTILRKFEEMNSIIEMMRNERNADAQNQQNEINKIKSSTEVIKDDIDELKKVKKSDENIIIVPFDNRDSNIFNGILTKLGNGNPLNLISNRVVNVTMSSIYGSHENYQPENVLNYSSDIKFIYTKNQPNSWLCIDFINHRVSLTHYAIRSHGHGNKGNYHLQNWDIVGSNDSNNWDHLDSRLQEKSLDARSASNVFDIQDITNKNNFYRYLKIIQTGVNTHNDDNCLAFSSIEFFGRIQINK